MFVADEPWDALISGAILAGMALLWALLLVRLVGLRSFSKMTPFDFVATIATGSLLAGAARSTDWLGYCQALAGMSGVFLVQMVLAWIRRRSDVASAIMTNCPKLLMRDGRFDVAAMRAARVARADVEAKLREANVRDLGQVRAVVLETTGNISVLHGEQLDPEILAGVEDGTAG